ncbi:MAG: CCA tRNA nucleotidyltransferase [Pseudorhodobacter sp.]
MKLEANWLSDPRSQALCAALEAAGHSALFVGGCVRNSLLGAPVSDLDMTTDALPEMVMNVAEKARYKVIPTGIAHGTVTVVVKGLPHEVTTFRRDLETDGRHAVVAFSASVAEDAARRDFTMNALYADRQGQVIDPLDGLPDLMARRVRFVGDAGARIREDYLRILRFFRFHAWYGTAGLDPDGLAACAENANDIRTLSRERVGAEMKKLLSAPDPSGAVAAMAASGVLAATLPGAAPGTLPVLVHFEDGTGDWLARLAALGGQDPGMRLRLSRNEVTRLNLIREQCEGMMESGELAWRYGAETARAVVLLRAASLGGHPPEGWQGQVARGASAEFPIRAADLMPGLSGPALGAALRDLEARWIAADFRPTREELLR